MSKQPMATPRNKIRCAVIGDANIGKTYFLDIWEGKPVDPKNIYKATPGFTYYADPNFVIYDTSGKNRVLALDKVCLHNKDIIFLCYATDDFQSLKNIAKWKADVEKECASYHDNVMPEFILVGLTKNPAKAKSVNQEDVDKLIGILYIKQHYEVDCSNPATVNAMLLSASKRIAEKNQAELDADKLQIVITDPSLPSRAWRKIIDFFKRHYLKFIFAGILAAILIPIAIFAWPALVTGAAVVGAAAAVSGFTIAYLGFSVTTIAFLATCMTVVGAFITSLGSYLLAKITDKLFTPSSERNPIAKALQDFRTPSTKGKSHADILRTIKEIQENSIKKDEEEVAESIALAEMITGDDKSEINDDNDSEIDELASNILGKDEDELSAFKR